MSLELTSGGYAYNTSDALGLTDLPLTIMVWFRQDTDSTDFMFYFTNDTTNSKRIFAQRQSDADVQVTQQLGGDNASPLIAGVSNSAWHIFITTVTSTTTAIYVDGSSNSSSGSYSYNTNDSPSIYLGISSGLASQWDGQLCHFAVWNTDLSGASITSLINKANPLAVESGNLVRYWPFTVNDANFWTDTQNDIVLTSFGNAAYGSLDPGVDAPPTGADVTYAYTLSIS